MKVKKKKKKQVTPRPSSKPSSLRSVLDELEDLLRIRERGELDDWEIAQRMHEAADRVGRRQVFEQMVNCLRDPYGELRAPNLWALQVLGGSHTLVWLWDIVRMSQKSTAARSAAIEAIERLGSTIDIRELPDDLVDKMYGSIGRVGKVMQDIDKATSAAEVERILLPLHYAMLEVERHTERGGAEIEASIVSLLENRPPSRTVANFIRALADTTPFPDIQELAEDALYDLEGFNIEPTSPAVLALHNQRFYKAYIGDAPNRSGDKWLLAAWERGDGQISTLLFVFQQQHPPGALVDVDMIDDITEREFRHHYIERSWLEGYPLREIPLEEAKEMLSRSLEIARINRLQLPAEWQELRPIIERRLFYDVALAEEEEI